MEERGERDVYKRQVKDDSLLKEMIARFGSDKILVEVDADIDFDKIPLHVDTFLVKHVDIDAEFERKMMRAGKQIIIRDSLLRNDLENLLKLEKVEGVSTNYYLGKELFKIKKAMKEAGINVNTFESAIDFSEFKLDDHGSVSYTHLDVYKRQPWIRWIISKIRMAASGWILHGR